MPQYPEERPDPSIAAISTGLIPFALPVLAIGSRTVGPNRMVR